jgi:type IV secretory pathway VirD2 relaxase
MKWNKTMNVERSEIKKAKKMNESSNNANGMKTLKERWYYFHHF